MIRNSDKIVRYIKKMTWNIAKMVRKITKIDKMVLNILKMVLNIAKNTALMICNILGTTFRDKKTLQIFEIRNTTRQFYLY